MKKVLIISILTVIVIAIGLGIYSYVKKPQTLIENKKEAQEVKQEVVEVDRSDWKTYKDEKYGFNFKYPAQWKVQPIKASDMGGEWYIIAPEKDTDNRRIRFEFAIFEFGKPFKSERSSKSWYQNNIEDPDKISDYKGETGELKINGLDSYFVGEVKGTYTRPSYVISQNNTVIYISFTEKDSSVDNSDYLDDFNYLVNTIKF